MMRILVTGATGFIGNYVVAELLRQGHYVIATSSNKMKAQEMPWIDNVEYIEFNIGNVDPGTNCFEYFSRPDKTIHLAWEGLPNYKSLFHFEINLPGHYNFLKNIITNGCRDITVAGTCLEYGMRNGMLSEEMLTDPTNPYALAKDSLNRFLVELHKSEKFTFRWVRLFYLFGNGQNPASLFSQLETALASDQEIFNMSGGEQVRDYLPVEKAAEYIVKIALQDRITGVVNCCSGQPVTVKELVEQFVKNSGKSIQLNLGHYNYPDYEPMSFWGDNKKLQQILNEE